MSEFTPRFALPLLQAGQAQKEIDHNEALALIDGALHPLAETIGDDSPPPAPGIGASWVIGSAPTDAWAGHAHALAIWTGGGWRFVTPLAGMTLWVAATGRPARWDGTAWRDGELVGTALIVAGEQVVGGRQGAISSPSGGTSVDLESRSAIGAILTALRSHGLIAA